MSSVKNSLSSFYSRIIDFTVLTLSFLILALITDFTNPMLILIDLSLYVFIMFFSLRICKHIVIEKVHTFGPIISIMLGNISGLITGAVIALTANQLFPGIGENVLMVIFPSVLAFFILGTLSPMIKPSHNDILHH